MADTQKLLLFFFNRDHDSEQTTSKQNNMQFTLGSGKMLIAAFELMI